MAYHQKTIQEESFSRVPLHKHIKMFHVKHWNKKKGGEKRGMRKNFFHSSFYYDKESSVISKRDRQNHVGSL